MATTTAASTLLRAFRNASLASRAAAMASRFARAAGAAAAAAAASRVAAAASRSARAVRAAAAAAGSGVVNPLDLIIRCSATRGGEETSTSTLPPRADAAPSRPRRRYICAADYARLPDDAKTATDGDVESDEAMRSLYAHWRKAFGKPERDDDDAELARRSKLFRRQAELVHEHNTFVPADPWEAAVHLGKRREAELLLSRDEDASLSHLDECHLPMQLGPFADGAEPELSESDMSRLKEIEDEERDDAAGSAAAV